MVSISKPKIFAHTQQDKILYILNLQIKFVFTSATEFNILTKKLLPVLLKFISIAKFCAGSFIPILEKTITFQDAIKRAKLNGSIIFPDPNGQQSWSEIKKIISQKNTINIFIGPEGGFSKEEVEFAKEQNAYILNLGERILRAETAAISVSSMVRFCLN